MSSKLSNKLDVQDDKITIISNRYEWFLTDVKRGQFKYSTTKRQTEKDQSFYSGHLKLDYA